LAANTAPSEQYKGDKMNRKIATFSFLGICVLLAILLLIKAISPLVSGVVFAIALVVFGIASRGFKN